jgi:transposase
MLKIVHRICCGIDVHKKFVVATVGITNKQGVTDYETRTFQTFTENLVQLKDWLTENKCVEVCMESTGKYWIPIFNILEDTCRVFVANPKYVKGIRGKKTDKRDSLWLCDLHKHGLVQNSFIPPWRIRQIRDLMRYRYKLTNFKSSEKNRAQNSLTVSNILLSSVVSDTFGKSSMRIVRHLLNDPADTSFDVAPLLDKRMKATAEEVTKSIQGNLTKPQVEKISVCLDHMDEIDKHIATVESAVLELAEPYMEQVKLLLTIPGIKDVFSAIGIIGEIGTDMSVFLSARHLCSWAGLVPANNESAGKKKSVRCARAGTYIKPLLVQCAHSAVKSKECPYFRVRYEQITRRRGKKKAIIAVAHMLLNCIYHMISRNEEFNYDLYRIENTLKPKAAKKSEFSKEDAIALLESLGAQVILPDAA